MSTGPARLRVDLMAFAGPLRQIQALARDAAAAGFAGLVVTEGGRTAYLSAAAAALAADLDLATGIAVAFPRSPMVTAQLAWELAEVTGGRFRLGLGTQVRAHVTRRYGTAFDPPGPRLREYVEAVRACFAAFRGAPLDFHGRYHELTLLPPAWSPGPIDVPDPPIDVAAVNPWMLEMAGAVADGVHVHPLNCPELLRQVIRPRVEAGARGAGRDPAAVSYTVPCLTAVGADPDERRGWRELARQQVAFYGSTPNYASVFDHLGFPGTTTALRAAMRAGDQAAMAAAVPDRLLDHFLVECRPEELGARLVERYGGLADRVVLYFAGVAWADNPKSLAAYGRAAAEASGR